MKTIVKVGLGIVTGAVLFFTGCNNTPENKHEVKAEEFVSEESLGLRKVDIYTENTVTPDATNYSKEYAGSGKVIARAFQDAPPMIPHDTEGMLPITTDNNQCIGCHMPAVAASLNATPIPMSHYTNFRPHHKYDGKKFEKSIDNMKNEVTIKESEMLVNARFNCTQCHAPQSDGQLVGNTFNPEFTSEDGASKSSWNGSKLTEGLDTLLGE